MARQYMTTAGQELQPRVSNGRLVPPGGRCALGVRARGSRDERAAERPGARPQPDLGQLGGGLDGRLQRARGRAGRVGRLGASPSRAIGRAGARCGRLGRRGRSVPPARAGASACRGRLGCRRGRPRSAGGRRGARRRPAWAACGRGRACRCGDAGACSAATRSRRAEVCRSSLQSSQATGAADLARLDVIQMLRIDPRTLKRPGELVVYIDLGTGAGARVDGPSQRP